MQNTFTENREGQARPSRRQFVTFGLRTLALVGAMMATNLVVFGQDKRQSQTVELPKSFELVRSKFSGHLSEYFSTNINGEAVHFQLIEVADLKRDSIAKSAQYKIHDEKFKEKVREESFTLAFRVATEIELHQTTYRLNHDTLGRIELFLVPVGKKDGPWQLFEAVFNRLQQ